MLGGGRGGRNAGPHGDPCRSARADQEVGSSATLAAIGIHCGWKVRSRKAAHTQGLLTKVMVFIHTALSKYYVALTGYY